jgi:helix-turn-helix protein
MSTIRRGPMAADEFTTVANAFARDARLSLKARGLGLWLFSHRDGWKLSVRAVAKQVGCGVDQVQSALKELEEHGYLVRERDRADGGRFDSMDYYVTDTPASAQVDTTYGKPIHGEPTRWKTRTHKKTSPKDTNSQEDQDAPLGSAGALAADGGLFDAPKTTPPEPTAKDVVAAYVDAFRVKAQGRNPIGSDIRKVGNQAKRMLGDGVPFDVLHRAATTLGASRFSDLQVPVRELLNGSGARANGSIGSPATYRNEDYWSTEEEPMTTATYPDTHGQWGEEAVR